VPQWERQGSFSATSVGSAASVGSYAVEGTEVEHYSAKGGGIPALLVRTVVRKAPWVIAGWALVFGISAFHAPRFLEAVKVSYDPEASMPSGVSMSMFNTFFPGIMDQTIDSVIFSLKPEVENRKADKLLADAIGVLDEVMATLKTDHPVVLADTHSWRGVQGASYISRDERSWLLQVVWRADSNEQRQETDAAATKLLKAVKSLNATYSHKGLEVVATGPHALREVVQAQSRHDIGFHAVMFLPFAILAIHLHLWRIELLPLPAICGFVSMALAFAVGYVVACNTIVDVNTPTLMAFLTISLCIDWCFFLCARYREELMRPCANLDAIVTAFSRTGKNVGLSGCLIVACFLCMLQMPSAIASTAVGGCIAVGSSLACCLTLLPAILACMPSCIVDNSVEGYADEELLAADSTQEPSTYHRTDGDSIDDGPHPLVSAAGAVERGGHHLHRCQHAVWYRWAKIVTQPPCNMACLILAAIVCVPCWVRLSQYKPAVAESLSFPPGDPAVKARARLDTDFGSTIHGSDMYILFESGEDCPDGVRSNGYFSAVCAAALRVLELSHPDRPVQASNLLGVEFYTQPGTNILACMPWRSEHSSMLEVYQALAHGNYSGHLLLTGRTHHVTMIPSDEFMHFNALYKELWGQCVSPSEEASLVRLRLPWNIMSWEGFDLVEDLRRLVTGMHGEPTACGELRAWELSFPSIWYDYVQASVGKLPLCLGLACVLTTPFVGLSFWSALAPLKLLATVLLPLAWVYSVAIWCFEDGGMDFLGEGTPTHSCGGFHWMVPCSSSMLLMSLALDYNIFYFGRVMEFRKGGLSDLEAIRQGLASTGPVITCAGFIFALEFSGLLLSDVAMSRQGGFVIVLGVLLDTFVVRSCLLPAALSCGAAWNWWPGRMPAVMSDPMSRTISVDSDKGLTPGM